MTSAPVRLVPYDDLWPREFAAEAARIEMACEDLPIRLEHIGSTAIPGMSAKPIIDILAGCPARANRAPYIAALRQLGYAHRGNNGIPGRDYFVRGSPRSHQVHLVSWSSALWRDHLAFRDYLRSHADVARQYEELKRQLAITFADDRRAFSDLARSHTKVRVIIGPHPSCSSPPEVESSGATRCELDRRARSSGRRPIR